jgi:hypothetical protein
MKGYNKMGITMQFIKLLGATDEESDIIIDKMNENTAKQILKIVIKELHKQRTNAEDL